MSQQRTSAFVSVLAKFGKRSHLEKLQRGTIYMKTVGYFRKLDASRGWGDPLEGLLAHLQPSRTKMLLKTRDRSWQVPSEELIGPILLTNHEYEHHHLFCLAAAHDEHAEAYLEHGTPIFSEKFLEDEEKDHVLLIKVKPFLERLEQGANALGRRFTRGLVIYYDEGAFHGDMTPFHKKSGLSWQQEFRVLFEPSHSDSLEIQIPSLEDVSALVPARDVNNYFTVRPIEIPETTG